MSCGETANAWVPSLVGSIWSGTVGTDSMIAAFTIVLGNKLAATTVGLVPGTGIWSKDSTGFHWTTTLEGISWTFNVHAESCNDNDDVTSAAGSAVDSLSNTKSVTMSRII